MNSLNTFGLAYEPFNSTDFQNRIGDRLERAGHEDIAQDLFVLGANRQYLAHDLKPDNRAQINDVATPILAEDAAAFQDVVAKVKVIENGERLVSLEQTAQDLELPWTFSEVPYHPACGEWANKPRLFWVRARVGQALISMTKILKEAEYGLHFEDAFRPLGVQEGLFARRYSMTAQEHPTWTEEQIILETRSKTAYTPRFAAHKGGAAVDVRLLDTSKHELVDIGHGYPDGGAIVAMESPYVTQRQWENRFLLNAVSKRFGFSAYPFEDWHFSLSDTTAAACNKGPTGLPAAEYGPIKHFDISTGEILETYSANELDTMFSPYGAH